MASIASGTPPAVWPTCERRPVYRRSRSLLVAAVVRRLTNGVHRCCIQAEGPYYPSAESTSDSRIGVTFQLANVSDTFPVPAALRYVRFLPHDDYPEAHRGLGRRPSV